MDEEILTTGQISIFRNKETELISLIEALNFLEQQKEWHLIKEVLFKKHLSALEKEIFFEVTKPVIDVNRTYKLQGEIASIKRYCEADKLIEGLKAQLESVKLKLKNAK